MRKFEFTPEGREAFLNWAKPFTRSLGTNEIEDLIDLVERDVSDVPPPPFGHFIRTIGCLNGVTSVLSTEWFVEVVSPESEVKTLTGTGATTSTPGTLCEMTVPRVITPVSLEFTFDHLGTPKPPESPPPGCMTGPWSRRFTAAGVDLFKAAFRRSYDCEARKMDIAAAEAQGPGVFRHPSAITGAPMSLPPEWFLMPPSPTPVVDWTADDDNQLASLLARKAAHEDCLRTKHVENLKRVMFEVDGGELPPDVLRRCMENAGKLIAALQPFSKEA